MLKIKRFLRLAMLVIILMLGASGAMFGAILPNNMRHKYQDNVIHIEMVDERRDEDENAELDMKDVE